MRLLLLTLLLFIGCIELQHSKVSRLLDSYLSGAVEQQSQSKSELLQIGEPATNAALSRINSADLNQKRKLLSLAASLGKPVTIVTEALLVSLTDKEPAIREIAALGLGRVAPSSQKIGLALKNSLQDPEPRVRAAAASSIGSLGELAVEVESFAELERLAYDREPYPSNSALNALNRLAPEKAAVVARKIAFRISQRIDDERPEVRLGAASLAGLLPVLHNMTEQKLISQLRNEPSLIVQAQIASSLARINSKNSLRASHPRLIELSQSPDLEASRLAREALQYLKAKHPEF